MRTITVSAAAGPLELSDADIPTPGPDELLIEVAYAGVNFIDTYRRRGIYPMPFPHTPGSEGSGRVIGRGREVEGWWDGTRVAWAQSAGSYADYVTIKARDALYVPDRIDLQTAAALPLQGMTAHYLINSVFPVTDETKLLITGGAGGVGRLACQLALDMGATVLATTSQHDKLPFMHATYPLVIDSWDDLPGMVKDLVGSLDVVYDGVGAVSFDATLATLRPRGLMCLFGGASGQVPPFALQRLNTGGSLYVTRPTLADYLGPEQEWRWDDLMSTVAAKRLDVLIGAVHDLSEAGTAHELLESGDSVGKILLAVNPDRR